MEKIKKGLTYRFIAVSQIIALILAAMVYSFPYNNSLRVPVGTKTTHDRIKEVQDRSDAKLAPIRILSEALKREQFVRYNGEICMVLKSEQVNLEDYGHGTIYVFSLFSKSKRVFDVSRPTIDTADEGEIIHLDLQAIEADEKAIKESIELFANLKKYIKDCTKKIELLKKKVREWSSIFSKRELGVILGTVRPTNYLTEGYIEFLEFIIAKMDEWRSVFSKEELKKILETIAEEDDRIIFAKWMIAEEDGLYAGAVEELLKRCRDIRFKKAFILYGGYYVTLYNRIECAKLDSIPPYEFVDFFDRILDSNILKFAEITLDRELERIPAGGDYTDVYADYAADEIFMILVKEKILSARTKANAAESIIKKYESKGATIDRNIAAKIVDNIFKEYGNNYLKISNNLNSLIGLLENESIDTVDPRIILKITEKAKEDMSIILDVLGKLYAKEIVADQFILNLIEALKGKTIVTVFNALLRYTETEGFSYVFRDLFQIHLTLFTDIAKRYGNAAGIIIESVIDGLRQNILPMDLSSERELIINFCDKIHSFSPAIYKAYKKIVGDKLKEQEFFNILQETNGKIIANSFNEEDMENLKGLLSIGADKELHEFLLAIYLAAIPPRDTSFLSIGDAAYLVEQSLLSKTDWAKHIPERLRGYKREDNVGIFERTKIDESLDYSFQINAWIDKLRVSGAETGLVTQEDLKNIFLDFINRKIDSEELRSKVERFLKKDREFINQLETIEREEDYYSKILKLSSLMDYVIKELLKPLLKPIIDENRADSLRNVDSLIKRLSNVPGIAISKIIGKIGTSELFTLKDAIEKSTKISPERKKIIIHAIDGLTNTRSDLASARIKNLDIVQTIWGKELEWLSLERENYRSTLSGSRSVAFRVVKGYPYVIWGLNCGICVAGDFDIWSNSNFFLLSIVENGLVEGFVILQEYKLKDGRRVLLVPGIDPTTHFLTDKDAGDVLNKIIETLQQIAVKEGYDAVYLPVDEDIHSNRTQIRKAIKNYGWQPINLDEKLFWGSSRHDYYIEEVYVLPKLETSKNNSLALDHTIPSQLERARESIDSSI